MIPLTYWQPRAFRDGIESYIDVAPRTYSGPIANYMAWSQREMRHGSGFANHGGEGYGDGINHAGHGNGDGVSRPAP